MKEAVKRLRLIGVSICEETVHLWLQVQTPAMGHLRASLFFPEGLWSVVGICFSLDLLDASLTDPASCSQPFAVSQKGDLSLKEETRTSCPVSIFYA